MARALFALALALIISVTCTAALPVDRVDAELAPAAMAVRFADTQTDAETEAETVADAETGSTAHSEANVNAEAQVSSVAETSSALQQRVQQIVQSLDAAAREAHTEWWGSTSDRAAERSGSPAFASAERLAADADAAADRERVFWSGVSRHDIDVSTANSAATTAHSRLPRFASHRHAQSMSVSAELSALMTMEQRTAVRERLKLQRERRQAAAQRRAAVGIRANANAVAGAVTQAQAQAEVRIPATPTALCTAMVAAIRHLYQQNNNVVPNAQAVATELANNANNYATLNNCDAVQQGDVQGLWDIVHHRARSLGHSPWQPGPLCNADVLAKGLLGVAAVGNPPHAIANWAVGLEEELCLVTMCRDDPEPADQATAMYYSGAGVYRAGIPVTSIMADQSGGYKILEVASGPMAVTAATRLFHRHVVDRLDASVPAFPNPNAAFADGDLGPDRLLDAVIAAYRNNLPQRIATSDLAHARGGTYPVGTGGGQFNPHIRRVFREQSCKYNSVQVNFEVSLCAIADSAPFLALSERTAPNALLRLARAAATDLLTSANNSGRRLPGLTLETFNSFTPQQRCDLKGLLTVFYQHAFSWAIRHRGLERTHANYLQAARVALYGGDWKVTNNYRYWTGHPKNMFNVMVKTAVNRIVEEIPHPLTDVIAELSRLEALNAGAVAAVLHTAFHDVLNAQLGGVNHPLMVFAGDIPTTNEPWLRVNGAHWITDVFGGCFHRLGTENPAPRSWSPAQPDSPRAFTYNHNNVRTIAVVAEARYQSQNLNRVFTAQQVLPNNAPLNANTAGLYTAYRIKQLAALQPGAAGGAGAQAQQLPNP